MPVCVLRARAPADEFETFCYSLAKDDHSSYRRVLEKVSDAAFSVQGPGCRVQGAGCRVQGVEGMGLGRGERICMWVFGRSVQLTCEHCWQEIKNFRFMPKNLSDRFFFLFF